MNAAQKIVAEVDSRNLVNPRRSGITAKIECTHNGECRLPPYPVCLCGAWGDDLITRPHVVHCPCGGFTYADLYDRAVLP